MSAPQNSFQGRDYPLTVARVFFFSVAFLDFLRSVPNLSGDYGLLFPLADGVFVFDFADVGMVVQNAVNVVAPPWLALPRPVSGRVEFSGNQLWGLDFDEPLKNGADYFCLIRTNDQPLVFNDIPEWNIAADPLSLLPACRWLYARLHGNV